MNNEPIQNNGLRCEPFLRYIRWKVVYGEKSGSGTRRQERTSAKRGYCMSITREFEMSMHVTK
jgi:hypothetical protein